MTALQTALSRAALPRAAAAALAVLLALALAAPPAAEAEAEAAGPVQADARARVSLVGGWAEPDGRRLAGLTLALAPGWKTYWRHPGEAGIPPAFDWSASTNVRAVAVRWPRPETFETWGMRSFGWGGEVTLALEVTPEDPALPMRLALDLFFGLCEEICIPAGARVALDIAPGEAPSGAPAVAAALAAEPSTLAEAGMTLERCGVVGAGEGRRVEAVVRLPAAPRTAPIAVLEGPAGLGLGMAETRLEGARLHVSAPLAPAGAWVDRGALRLTVLAPGVAAEALGCR